MPPFWDPRFFFPTWTAFFWATNHRSAGATFCYHLRIPFTASLGWSLSLAPPWFSYFLLFSLILVAHPSQDGCLWGKFTESFPAWKYLYSTLVFVWQFGWNLNSRLKSFSLNLKASHHYHPASSVSIPKSIMSFWLPMIFMWALCSSEIPKWYALVGSYCVWHLVILLIESSISFWIFKDSHPLGVWNILIVFLQ